MINLYSYKDAFDRRVYAVRCRRANEWWETHFNTLREAICYAVCVQPWC